MKNIYRTMALLLAMFSLSYGNAAINPGVVKKTFSSGDEVVIYAASTDDYLAGFNTARTGIIKTRKTSEDNVYLLTMKESINGNPAFILKQKSTNLYVQILSNQALNMNNRESNATPFQFVPPTEKTCTRWWPSGKEEFDATVQFSDITLMAIQNPNVGARDTIPLLYLCSIGTGAACEVNSYTDTNAWVFYTVDTSVRPNLGEFLESNPTSMFPIGTVPGTYPEALVNAYAEAYNSAETLYKNANATEEDLIAAYDALTKALEAVKAGVVPFEGYYRIVSGFKAFFDQQNVEKAIFDNGSALRWDSRWDSLATTTPKYVFKFTKQEDGKYLIQNLLTGNYITNGLGRNSGVNTGTSMEYGVTIREIFPSEGATNDGRQFNLVPGGSTEAIHAAGHGNGGGSSGNIIGWNAGYGGASSWVLRAVADDELAVLQSTAERQRISEKLAELIVSGYSKYNLAAVGTRSETGLIELAEQFSSNADQNTTGQLDGGGFEALIDNDTTTYFHSSWQNGPRAFHYLQVSLEEPKQSFMFGFHRRITNNNNRPTNIRISASEDGENWVTKWYITSGFPTVNTIGNYESSVVDLGKAYKHVRFTILSTNSGGANNGYPFVTFSEFQMYDATINANAQISQHREVAQALREALQKALSKLENAEQSDIDELQAAITNFSNTLLDPTEFKAAIATATSVSTRAIAGEDPGQYPSYAIATLQAAIEAARVALEDDNATKESYATAIEVLNQAVATFKGTLITKITPNKWYYIKGSSQAKGSMQNKYMYYRGGTGNDAIGFGNLNTHRDTINTYLWRLVQLSDTLYAIQNLSNFEFLSQSTGVAGARARTNVTIPGRYEIVPLGGDAFNINEPGKLPLHGQDNGTVVVYWEGGIGSGSVWAFESANLSEEPEELVAVMGGYTVGDYTAMCLSVNLEGIQDATAYSVVGVNRNAEGTATSINLKAYEGGIVPAGMPFILKAESTEVVFAWGSEGTLEAKTQNGLVGTFSQMILEEGFGYVNDGKLYASNGGYVLAANQAYINDALIVVNESGDATIAIEGVLSGIDEVTTRDGNELVNVYTVSGVQVRSKVKASEATNGLPKGFYIVGNKKVVVK